MSPFQRTAAGLLLGATLAVGPGLAAHAASGSAPGAGSPAALAQACSAAGWTQATGVTSPVYTLAGSHEHDWLFAGSISESAPGVFRGGPSTAWQKLNDMALVRVTDIAVGPGMTPRIWVAERGAGVWVSDTGGASFRAESGLPALASVTAVAPVTSTVLAAASSAAARGIYGWQAATDTWVLRGGHDIPTPVFYDLEVGPRDTLWLATEAAGLWRSVDKGVNWTQVDLAGRVTSTVFDVAIDPGTPRRIYLAQGQPRKVPPAGIEPGGVSVSENDGVGWFPALTDIDNVTSVAPLSTQSLTAYAAGWGRGLLVTTNGGRTWRGVPGPKTASDPNAAIFVENLLAVQPRGVGTDCELLVAGGASGVFMRNVARTTYTSVYLPTVACTSPVCNPAGAAAARRSARADLAPGGEGSP